MNIKEMQSACMSLANDLTMVANGGAVLVFCAGNGRVGSIQIHDEGYSKVVVETVFAVLSGLTGKEDVINEFRAPVR